MSWGAENSLRASKYGLKYDRPSLLAPLVYSFYIVNKKIERHIKQCCCCPCDEYFLVDDVVLQRKNKDGKIKSFITSVNYISDLNNLADFMIRVWKLDKPCYLGS